MIAEIQNGEPLAFVAGDTVKWRRADLGGKYPVAAGAKLTYEVRLVSGEITADNKLTVTAARDGDDFVATIDKTASAKLTPGKYDWQAYVADAGDTERVKVDQGVLNVMADLASVGIGTRDARTQARRALDAIEAVLADTATANQKSYQIDGRRLDRFSRAELLALQSRLQRQVDAENDAERLRRGRLDGRRIGTRFR